MSANTYVLIRKEKDRWAGYVESRSIKIPTYQRLVFVTSVLEIALSNAQVLETEYGYRFEDLNELTS
jgi:hypothetical protein